MDFEHHQFDPEQRSACELMKQQLSATDGIPEQHRMKAMIMSIHPAIAHLAEPIVKAIKEGMEHKPEEIEDREGEAMLYHDMMSTILMGLLIRVKAEMEIAEVGCFHPKEKTLDSQDRLLSQDIPESIQDLDLASMETAQIMKMLGVDDDELN